MLNPTEFHETQNLSKAFCGDFTDRQTDRCIPLHKWRSVFTSLRTPVNNPKPHYSCTSTSLLGAVSHWVDFRQEFLISSPFPQKYSHAVCLTLLSLFLSCPNRNLEACNNRVDQSLNQAVAVQADKERKEESHPLRSWTQETLSPAIYGPTDSCATAADRAIVTSNSVPTKLNVKNLFFVLRKAFYSRKTPLNHEYKQQ